MDVASVVESFPRLSPETFHRSIWRAGGETFDFRRLNFKLPVFERTGWFGLVGRSVGRWRRRLPPDARKDAAFSRRRILPSPSPRRRRDLNAVFEDSPRREDVRKSTHHHQLSLHLKVRSSPNPTTNHLCQHIGCFQLQSSYCLYCSQNRRRSLISIGQTQKKNNWLIFQSFLAHKST